MCICRGDVVLRTTISILYFTDEEITNIVIKIIKYRIKPLIPIPNLSFGLRSIINSLRPGGGGSWRTYNE